MLFNNNDAKISINKHINKRWVGFNIRLTFKTISMRKKTIIESELPDENLALYQLIKEKTGGILKDFALSLELQPQTIQRLFKIDKRTGRYPSVSTEIKRKVSEKYGIPEDWCEAMAENIENQKAEAEITVSTDLRPRILNYAFAGPLTDEIKEAKEYAPVNRMLPKYDCTIIIRGDSMEPTYHSGDEIAILDVTGTGFIQWGKAYILDTSQGAIIKRLYNDEKGIKCVSDNKLYEPFVISRREILHIYKIVGFVRIEG